MNIVIVLCLILLTVVSVTMIFSRSHAMQRAGAAGLVLILAISGCSSYGYLKAKEFAEEQYEKMYMLALGNTYSYMQQLESNEEIYSYNSEETLKESAEILNRTFPVLSEGEESFCYLNMALLCKDEAGDYYECYSDGQDSEFWDNIQETGVKLIESSIKKQSAVGEKTGNGTLLLAVTDKTRIAPVYAMLVNVSEKPVHDSFQRLKLQYFLFGLLFLAAGMALTGVVLAFQEQEIRKMIQVVGQVADGRKSWDDLKVSKGSLFRESNEMHTLQSGLWQIASNIEWMNYSQYRVLQAYYRFAPKQIEKILNRQSILDVGPLDKINTEGTLAFVSFSVDETLPERDYLRQMNRNYALLGEIRKEYDGIIISGNSDLSVIQLMFHEETRKALQFGIKLVTRENTDDTVGQAFLLLHKTAFVYGVAGDEEQAFTYVHSNEMKVLENYIDDLRQMGVRMVVTDYVHEVIENDAVTRYIGYIENGDYNFNLYEVLDAHSADERQKRLDLKSKFQKALSLFYKSDFYLARNLFSEVLRICPSDEVAKWYLFLCENSLNSENADRQSFALFARK